MSVGPVRRKWLEWRYRRILRRYGLPRRWRPVPPFEEQVDAVELVLPRVAEFHGVSIEEARRMWWAPFPSIREET